MESRIRLFALAAASVSVLAAALEGWHLHRRGSYDWKAYASSLADLIGRQLINRVLGLGVTGAVLALAAHWRLADIQMDSVWSWLVLFVGQDFLYYWMHRADHRMRWLWASHCVHHSPNQYTLATAYRLGWTGNITGGAIFFAPLVLIGFPVPYVLLAIATNLIYQFWLHTELAPSLGPLEWVFNTPAHHRVHHASNPQYLDRNYGGVLIIFDRLFGTFARETVDDLCRYGLVHPLHSYNPVRIALHGWSELWDDLRRAQGLREIGHTLFGPPT